MYKYIPIHKVQLKFLGSGCKIFCVFTSRMLTTMAGKLQRRKTMTTQSSMLASPSSRAWVLQPQIINTQGRGFIEKCTADMFIGLTSYSHSSSAPLLKVSKAFHGNFDKMKSNNT